MSSSNVDQEIQELLHQIHLQLEDYQHKMDQIGMERQEVLRLFARRLERMEVEQMQERIQRNFYGKAEL